MELHYITAMQTRQKLFKPAEPAGPIEPADGEILPLNQRPEYQETLQELQDLEAVHAQREAEKKRLMALNRGEKTKKTPTELAKSLLGGGRVDPVSAEDKLVAINEELQILRQAIFEKTRQLDAIAGQISSVEELRWQPEYLAAMNSMHDHLRAALDDYKRAAAIPMRLQQAGLRSSSFVMPDLIPYSLRAVDAYELMAMRRELDMLEARR